MKVIRRITIITLLLAFCNFGSMFVFLNAKAQSLVPEISNISPDYFNTFSGAPNVITGENFGTDDIQVWGWTPTEKVTVGTTFDEKSLPKLPDIPPADASQVSLLGNEKQVITAQLTDDVIWVKNNAGFSKPYLINKVKPFWISEDTVEQGASFSIYNLGMDLTNPYLVLTNGKNTYDLSKNLFENERSGRDTDDFLINVDLPNDIIPANYDVYMNNGSSIYSWAKAGSITVTKQTDKAYMGFLGNMSATQKDKYKVFDVKSFGAKGDGQKDDFSAIMKAINKAKSVGGIVFFAPGTYMTDETIQVPDNVKLVGSGQENCVIEGYGYDPRTSNIAWYSSNINNANVPYSVIYLYDNTSMDSLTIKGAAGKGIGGMSLVELGPQTFTLNGGGGTVSNVIIQNCKITADSENYLTGDKLYKSSIYSPCYTKSVKILNNDITGYVFLGGYASYVERGDIIGNTIHGGLTTASDIRSLYMECADCIVDKNQFVDTPGRIMIDSYRHSYIRLNEVHDFALGTSDDCEEVYLSHGDNSNAMRTVGDATKATSTTLTDNKQNWTDNIYSNAVVVITAGRGMGQYRFISSNSNKTLTLQQPFNVVPDSTSEYMVGFFYTENVYNSNLNDSVGRMSLWRDQIGNIVVGQRDDRGGLDIQALDNSKVDPNTNTVISQDMTLAWYNVIANSWIDGSCINLVSQAVVGSAFRGTPMFDNSIVNTSINNAALDRTGFPMTKSTNTSITLGNDWNGVSDRIDTSYTMLVNNTIMDGYTGISISKFSRDTYVLRNFFDNIKVPVVDNGQLTTFTGNNTNVYNDNGVVNKVSIPDSTSTSDAIPEKTVGVYNISTNNSLYSNQYQKIYSIISDFTHQDVSSKADLDECTNNLKQLYSLLKKYETKNGSLPLASFYPSKPSGMDNLINILDVNLGVKAEKYGTCPTFSNELKGKTNIEYVYNQELGGDTFSNVKDPHNTWVLMDMSGIHNWMVQNAFAGHSIQETVDGKTTTIGVYNVLYADGTVRQLDASKTPAVKLLVPTVFNKIVKKGLPDVNSTLVTTTTDYTFQIVVASVAVVLIALIICGIIIFRRKKVIKN